MIKIPKIIHQTWKNDQLPEAFKLYSQSWRDMLPGWEYRLWTDEMNREFVRAHYPDFLRKYDDYPKNIQRADAIRYLLLQTLEGLLIIPATSTMNTDQQLYSNIRITSTGQLTIQSNVELMGNSRVIVEGGGKLIIDGGTLSNVDLLLKAGASLQIINDGIIVTRNGFEAPIGVKVEIINGKIL